MDRQADFRAPRLLPPAGAPQLRGLAGGDGEQPAIRGEHHARGLVTLAVERRANVILNSSAWPVVRAEHLRILALARAVENQSYFIIANRVGTDDGVTFCGSSLIVDPSGAILAAASPDREELIQAEVSEQVIADVRNRVTVFAHRRPELYNISQNNR